MPPRRATIVALTAFLVTFAACSRDREPAIVERPPEVADAVREELEAPPPQLSAEELAPVIREVAEAGVGPTKIVVELARPVAEASQLSEALGEGTVLTVDPPVAGELKLTSPTTLTFVPAEGFRPATRYRVELEALEIAAGVLETPETGRWTRVFTTPDFGFARFSLAGVDYARKRAEAHLVFSGPVDPREVEKRARISVVSPGGAARRAASVRFRPGPVRHTVLAQLAGDAIRGGSRLELELDDGVPSAVDPERRASSRTASVDLATGPVAKILDAYRAEGSSGFYVQVICDDSAAGSRRYHWDRVRQEYYQVSARCQLDEADAAFGIHFDPPVEYSISPSGGGFRIFGDFERGSYSLRIEAGVKTADGGILHQDYETDFTVPARRPSVRFVSKGRYLPRDAWTSLPVRHLNLSSATLTVRHVPAENLVFWMSDDESEAAGERTSNLVLKTRVALAGEPDVEATTYVDLRSLVPAETRGLLELRLDAGGAHDTARILLTDLHLVAKRAGSPGKGAQDASAAGASREVRAWALDNETLQPVRGAEIRLVRKSGYVLATCRTGRDGGCGLRPPADPADPSPAFALVASRGADLTYLKFSELRAEVQEARIAGEPYGGAAAYRAAIYSDRGVYRPGETAHLAAIVRDKTHRAPPAGMPVVARLVDPRGKTLKRETLATNAAGYLTLDVDFPAFAATGRYETRLEVARKQIGQYRFQVEEFVPERMKVTVSSARSEYLLGENMEVGVAARYLFGGVPAGHRVEVSCEVAPGAFAPRENASFHYGVWRPESSPERPLNLGTLTAELDAEGAGTFACPGGGRSGGFRGPARLIARAAVFESGSGRTTVAQTSVPVHPERFYLGLASGAAKVEAGSELVVEGVVVDWQGARFDGVETVELELVRLESEYDWYYDEALGHETYRRYLRPVVEASATAPVVDGRFRAAWKPENDGVAFLVRAVAGSARTDLELEGRGDWYYWAPQETEADQTPRPARPVWIALETPETARVGERFPVQLKVPYRGRMLMTVETDRLLESEWMEVEPGDAVWFAEVDEFTPNIYVTAFLVKDPHLDSPQAYLPDRAFGVTSVTVAPEPFTHQVQLAAPAEVRSSSRLSVTLDLGRPDRDAGPTYATVAVVDQGILSLTGFESPDPFAAIFARRALGVETFETVGWSLLVPPAGPSAVEGGDQAPGLGRVQPVKPVALWSGLLEVPASGKLEVGFDVPQYRGELRVMAVTAGAERMGHADAEVTVRDPLVVQATLPRFLTAGDEIRLPVRLTNLSGARREVEVVLEAQDLAVPGLETPANGGVPPVEVLGPSRRILTLDDGAGDVALFRARARRASGAAKLKVTARAGDLRSVEETDVPLLPAGPKSRVVRRIELEEGRTDLTPYLEGWVPLSERTTLWATANPYGDTFDHLKHLVRYPYGCLEQTTSSTRPLLYLGSFVERVDPSLTSGDAASAPLGGADVESMARYGIRRLLSMQTPDGGFAYWPGSTEPAYWASAYAVHLLLDARELGYPVDEDRLDEALGWMERQITNVYEAGGERARRDGYSENAEPYMHFVLARAQRARKARILKLIEALSSNPGGERREHLAMLQAALYQAGDHRFESELKRPDLSPVSDHRDNGWSFYSDRRRRGFLLATFVDLFGRDPAGAPLADLVAQALRGHRSGWYTTQELVWGITGLGKFVEAGAREFAPPVLHADDRRIAPVPSDRGGDRTWNLARASEYRRLELDVPAKGEGKLYLILSSEGVREQPDWRTGGEGLALERRYLNAAGQPLDGGLALGDLVYVELSLANTTAERVANVALVDRIPAGWEIENPRLGRDATAGWIAADELWQADHMDLRDDRIELFGHLGRGEKRKVVYVARAVTAGRFTVPPVEAEAMYDPRIWAREGMRKIEVAGPWGEQAGAAAGAQK